MEEDQTRSYSFKDLSGLLQQAGDDKVEMEEAESEDVIDGDLVRELSTLSSVPWIGDKPEHIEESATPIIASLRPSAVREGEGLDLPMVDHVDALPWFQLVQTLRDEAEQAHGQRAAVLYHELGRIHETHLGDLDEALTCYQRSHEQDPTLGPNIQSLTRMLGSRGRYDEVRAVLEQELATASSISEQSSILTAAARVKLQALSDTRGAHEDLLEALELDADNRVASELLEALYHATGDSTSLQTLWERRLELWSDPALRSVLLTEMARLRERELKDFAAGAEFYQQAIEIYPQNAIAQWAMLRTARFTKDHPSAATLYEQLAKDDMTHDGVSALLAAARLYAGPLGDFPEAINCLRRACSLAPEDPLPLSELALILEQAGHWEELASVLGEAASSAGNTPEAAELYHWLARVRMQRLEDPDGSIEALEQAANISPDHTPARRMLGQLYLFKERYEDLIALHAREMDLFSDNRRRAATYYRMGDLLEHRLKDLDRAEESYRRSLMVSPGYRPAIRGLSRVLSSLGRYNDLVSIYQRIVDSIEDQGEKIRILHQLAEIWELKLDDPMSAIAGYEHLLAIEPDNLPALRALRRLYTSCGRWQDLADVLHAEVARSEAPRRIVALLSEITEVQQNKLVDHRAALITSLDALDRDPSFVPAQAAAIGLLMQLGDHQRLLQLYRNQLERCVHVDQRAWLLMKIGRLLEERPESREHAAMAYVEAMTQSTAPQILADQLIRLYLGATNNEELMQLLVKLPLPQSPCAQALHHRRVAEISLDNQPLALVEERLRRSLASSFDDAALRLLLRACPRQRERKHLIDLFELELQHAHDPLARTSARLKLAWLWSLAAHDLDRATETLLELVEQSADSGALFKQLCWMLCRLEQWDTLLENLKRCHDLFAQQEHRMACLIEMASICKDRLDDLPGAAALALRLMDGGQISSEVLSILEHHFRVEGNAVGLAQILGQHYTGAQIVPERAAMLTAIASLEVKGGELQQGAELFKVAMSLRPGYLPAARGLSRVAQTLGAHDKMARALEVEANASEDRLHQIRSFLAAGRAWLSAGQHESRAMEAFRRVLEIDPGHLEATDALLEILALTKHDEEVLALIDRLAVRAKDSAPHRDLLVRSAAKLRHRYLNPTAALRALEHALDLDADNRELLSTIVDLYREIGDWQAVTDINRRLLPLTTDPGQRRDLHRELGQIGDEKLPDSDVAIDQFMHVVNLDPDDIESVEALGRLLVREKDWEAAARTIEALTRKEPRRDRLKGHFLLLAEIYSEGLNDLPAAMSACRRALALDPGDLGIADKMISLLPKHEDKQTLDAHLQSSLSVHGARLDRNPFHIASYIALRDGYDRQKLWDRSYVVRCLLTAIGAGEEQDWNFIKQRQARVPIYPKERLAEKQVTRIIHPDELSIRPLLLASEAILREHIAPPPGGETRGRRFTERSHPELTMMLDALESVMGGVEYRRLMVAGELERLAVADTLPPTLFVGRNLEGVPTGELRFLLAGLLAHIKLRHVYFNRLGPGKFGEVVTAIISAVLPSLATSVSSPLLDNLIPALGQKLSAEVIESLKPACQHLQKERLDPMRWIEAMAHSDDRLALLITGDIPSAIYALARVESQCDPEDLDTVEAFASIAGVRLRHLLSFAVSEEHLSMREQLGMAVDGQP